MKLKFYPIYILLVLLLLGCMSVDPQFELDRYAVYYGSTTLPELAQFDLIIVQPEIFSSADLDFLQSKGTKVIAYLSTCEGEPWRSWWNSIDKSMILEQNQVWGSYYMDLSTGGWTGFLEDSVIPDILKKGFDGLFLDTVDAVDLYPQLKKPLINFIFKIAESYPDKMLIQNRGYAILPETAPVLDAVMIESMCTNYDFSSRKYLQRYTPDIYQKLAYFKRKYGIQILSLDYTETRTDDELSRVFKIADKYGFIPYVSTIDLQILYTDQPLP